MNFGIVNEYTDEAGLIHSRGQAIAALRKGHVLLGVSSGMEHRWCHDHGPMMTMVGKDSPAIPSVMTDGPWAIAPEVEPEANGGDIDWTQWADKFIEKYLPIVMSMSNPSKGTANRVLGFEQTTVGALASVDLRSIPQFAFRPHRLDIMPELSKYFVLNELRIGTKSIMLGTKPVPMTAFLETGRNLECPEAAPNETILMRVTNVTPNALDFRAALLGEVPLGEPSFAERFSVRNPVNHPNAPSDAPWEHE